MKSIELANKRIIIAPFNTEAIFLFHQLVCDGIEVIAFMDTDPSLHNSAYMGTIIIPYFHFEGNNEIAVLATPGYVSGDVIYQELLKANYRDGEILRQKEIEFNCHMEDIIDDIDLQILSKMRNLNWIYLLKSKIYRYSKKDGFSIPTIGLHITTRCTLKCKGCGELMDYFRPNDRRDMKLEDTLRTLDLLMEYVDFVDEVLPIGGETFLYKNLDKLLMHIVSSQYTRKIGRVTLFTNGTILPSKSTLEILGDNRHLFQICISDYGRASLKKWELISLFNQYGCCYLRVARDAWYLHAQPIIPSLSITEGEIRQKCNSCICRGDGMLRVVENKVYNCFFVAMAAECHAIPQDRRNYIDFSIDSVSKESLHRFADEIHPGMAYCGGYSYDHKGERILLPIGVQTAAVRECVRYDE